MGVVTFPRLIASQRINVSPWTKDIVLNYCIMTYDLTGTNLLLLRLLKKL